MPAGINGVEEDMEPTVVTALPSDVAYEHFLRVGAHLLRSGVAKRQSEMGVSAKDLPLVGLVDVHCKSEGEEGRAPQIVTPLSSLSYRQFTLGMHVRKGVHSLA
jgi:hypothetical protein